MTHKKSVIDYCGVRIRNATQEGARDVTGYVLVWDLLTLMLRQNGVSQPSHRILIIGLSYPEGIKFKAQQQFYRFTNS